MGNKPDSPTIGMVYVYDELAYLALVVGCTPSVCLLSVTCVHPTQGFNFVTFRGYFCTVL